MLEPVLQWESLALGRQFAPVEVVLDDDLVDRYLSATGESHPLYARGASGGYAPFLLTTMVRYSKAAIQGRWPSGSVQLTHRIACRRAVRRGETLRLACEVVLHEVRRGRGYYELLTRIENGAGQPVGEYAARSLWGEPLTHLADSGSAGIATAATSPARVDQPALATKAPVNASLRPIVQHYAAPDLQAFGEVAAARDPIHLDPKFALGTRYGRNIVQGRLVMTLLSRLMLATHGRDWLESGWFDLRFSGPSFVDEAVTASATLLSPPGSHPPPPVYQMQCRDAGGRSIIDGNGGVG